VSEQAPTILIVEDDEMNGELLRTVFRRNGFEVLHARSGAQALDMAQASLPDVIVSDVNLGTMSGYEVCLGIRGNAATAHIPFIIQTAADNETERQKAVNAGATDFVPKMRGWPLLVERVKSALA
jgi:two-component system, cell cycle response regulator DivK